MNHVYWIAGEISGDTHAAGLMNELQQILPEVKFSGLGGRMMQKVSGSEIEDWVETAGVVGLWDVLKMYGYFKRKFAEVLEAVHETPPDAIVLVDYPGFNLRLARALREAGFRGRLIYYISPQVWAWKRGRIKTMAELLDLMICIFPFEKPLYEASGLRTEFGGHPLVDKTRDLSRERTREHALVGWFPGSRRHEVARIFPVMLKAAQLIQSKIPEVRFVTSAASEERATEMRSLAVKHGMPNARSWIETGTVYDLMQRVEVGAVASGTATLEAACFGLPYVLVYKVNALTYWVGRALVEVSYLGMVNILAGKLIVPEMVQQELTAKALAEAMLELLRNPERRLQLQTDMAHTVSQLGSGGAYRRTAEIIASELSSNV